MIALKPMEFPPTVVMEEVSLTDGSKKTKALGTYKPWA